MGKRNYYKKRCMLCGKKAVERNDDIYLCRVHRSKKLDSDKVYKINGKEITFK